MNAPERVRSLRIMLKLALPSRNHGRGPLACKAHNWIKEEGDLGKQERGIKSPLDDLQLIDIP
jgi:hypothetical protein